MDQDKPAIVIDNGSYQCKAGFEGEDIPRSIFKAVVGRPKIDYFNSKEVYVGDEAMFMRGSLSIKSPFENGIIQNWEDMEAILHYVFFNQLRVDSENHPILITESPMNPSANREKMAQILFETFNVPSFYPALQGLLTLYDCSRTLGLVLDSGHEVSNIVPVDGFPLLNSALRIDLAGSTCTNNLIFLMNELGIKFSKCENDLIIVQEIKEKLCYVALDYEDEMKKYKESTAHDRRYELPDGNEFMVKNQRFRCPELLFQPYNYGIQYLGFNPEYLGVQYIGNQTLGIHQYINNSIKKCDSDLRRYLYQNVVLAGGNTLIPGFKNRLQKELKSLTSKNMVVKVIEPENRQLSCWRGGSIIAQMATFKNTFITKKEYNENGPSIIYKKDYQRSSIEKFIN